MTVMPKFLFTYVIVTILLETESVFAQAPPLSPTLENQLNREVRNAACCSKKMRCCKRSTPPANIEIRAVIARCINPPNICNKDRNIKTALNVGNAHNLQKFQGFDEDEPLVQSEVTKCIRKLILTIKMKNDGDTNTKLQYIVIDHVYDPISEKTVRLLNPYVIKMKQEQLSQAYGLRFVDFVNSQAKEQVYNKHDGNYTGCCIDSKKPTCGLITYHGRTIPFSQGFCCSCDAEKNVARQPNRDPNTVIAFSDPAYLYDAVQCPRTLISDEEKDSAVKPKNRKKKKKKKKKKKGKKWSNKKRGMEEEDDDEDLYFIDKNLKYPKENIHSLNSNHLQADNNYKIQSMNDQYEDQLTNQINFPTRLQESTTTENEGIQDKKPEEKSTSTEGNRKEKVNSFQGKQDQIYEHKKQSMMDNAFAKQQNQKPSVHRLLHMSKAPSPDKAYDFNADIKKIADQAFQNAIKSYSEVNKSISSRLAREDSIPEPYHKFYAKRQVQSSGVQRRGGQNCADRYTPPNLNPETYHESTHCLRFSPIWYGVYKLEKPLVDQTIIFQVYQKYETQTGVVRWKDLTKGQKVKMGTFYKYYEDELPTISMAFYSVFDDEDFCLNWNKLRLLIPEGVPTAEMQKYPEARGGPPEYLMVPAEKIVLAGDQCDVAGVGFEAFFKQNDRCSSPRGSCLQHQPYHLWHYDKTIERSGKKGCFFLKHHGKLSKNPITKNETTNEKYLILNYYGKYISMVDMEINADFNAVLRPTSSAIITEVYIDSTCLSSTSIVVKVSNSGLLSSRFKVRVCDCPLELQNNLDQLESDLVIIPPQHQHIFRLNFHSQIQADIFHCSVEALNAQDELVALRRIRVQKLDRCICTWHCLCACIGSSTGLKCVPMKIDHYHAAGFKGGMPIVTYADRENLTGDIYRLIIFILLFIVFTLLILGFTKAILGLCCLPIGMWGLNVLLDLPKPMKRYYERNLTGRPVEYDEAGWPIHPDTKKKVKNIPTPTEFATNVVFFFTYPTVVFLLVIKRICCPFYAYEKIRKPKQQKKKNWFKKRKCDLQTCMSRGMQTDEDAASVASMESAGSGKKKKKDLKKTKSKSKEELKEEDAGDKSVEGSRESSLKQPSDTSTDSKGKKKKKQSRKSRSPKRKSPDSKKRKKGKSPKRSKSPKKSKSPKRSKSPKSSNTEMRGQGEEDSQKKKPTIKVSIKEHNKGKRSRSASPKRRSSIEISDNPYYYSSTDDAAYSSSSPSTTKTAKKNKRSSKTSTA